MPRSLARHWGLDPEVIQLNHGSYGGTPLAVLEAQSRVRAEMEADLTRYYMEGLTPALQRSRAALAAFLDADAEDLVFVVNASQGAATVFANVPLGPGDEVLVSHHEYASCLHQLERDAHVRGFTVTSADVPFPLPPNADEARADIERAIVSRVTDRTRLVLLSWITSSSAIVMPIEPIVRAIRARAPECRVLIDAAHAPGQIPIDMKALESIGVDYLTGNLHKWVGAPKSSAFVWVRRGLHASGSATPSGAFEPLTMSSRAGHTPEGLSRLHHLFDYTATADFSAWAVVPETLDTMRAIGDELDDPSGLKGWGALRAHNNELCRWGRDLICNAVDAEPPVPDDLLAHMAVVVLAPIERDASTINGDPLWARLRHEHGIQVPVWVQPGVDLRCLRISCQAYNEICDYERLAAALRDEMAR
ncbi:MAG: aminotransferase class V-fold PLP-dependent enzyme [Planctomycetota bacterium]